MANKINIQNNRIVFDGHAETLQDCQLITAVCDALDQSSNFRTVKYDNGYAEFERLGGGEVAKFLSAAEFDLYDLDGTFKDSFQVSVGVGGYTTYVEFTPTALNFYNSSTSTTIAKTVGYEFANLVGFSSTFGGEVEYEFGQRYSFLNESGCIYPFYPVAKATPTLSYDLSQLSLDVGNYSISVVAKAERYLNSAPSNAVEYTVGAEEDELAGTWVFNDDIDIRTTFNYNVNFTNDSVSYTNLYVSRSFSRGYILHYANTSSDNEAYVYNDPAGEIWWFNDKYKTITITSKLADVTNGEELLAWLKANATKQGTTSLPVWSGTDLTGTTWHVPVGWEAEAGYGKFTINCSIDDTSGEQFYIGYYDALGEGVATSTANKVGIYISGFPQCTPPNTKDFTITFTGGTAATSLSLIAWLRQNGELISHTLPEQGKVFTQGYTVTISSEYTWSLVESKNEVALMLTLLDGSFVYVGVGDHSETSKTWTDVVALTCADYVSFTEGGLANYLENGTYFLSADITIDKILYLNCIDENTLVTMADGSAKRLGDVEVGDEVLSIDYDTMTLIARKVIYSGKDEPDYDNWFVNCYWENVFSDGTIIKQAMNHRFYNLENELYVYMKDWNTGEHTYKLDGTNPELVSRTLVQGRINYGRITLENSNNYFANGLSTADRRACPNKVVLNAPLQRQ